MIEFIKSKNNLSEIDLKTEGIKSYINQRNHFEMLIIFASKSTQFSTNKDSEHYVIILKGLLELSLNGHKKYFLKTKIQFIKKIYLRIDNIFFYAFICSKN